MKYAFVFLGRSILGILADAQSVLEGYQVVVVKADDERLEVPAGLAAMPVSLAVEVLQGSGTNDECSIDQSHTEVLLVANGGMTGQLVPVLFALTRGLEGFRGRYRVLEVMRGGEVRDLIPGRGPLEDGEHYIIVGGVGCHVIAASYPSGDEELYAVETESGEHKLVRWIHEGCGSRPEFVDPFEYRNLYYALGDELDESYWRLVPGGKWKEVKNDPPTTIDQILADE